MALIDPSGDVVQDDPWQSGMLTTSNNDEDKLAAYNEQVAGYLLKSNTADDFRHITRLLNSYRSVVEFPPEIV